MIKESMDGHFSKHFDELHLRSLPKKIPFQTRRLEGQLLDYDAIVAIYHSALKLTIALVNVKISTFAIMLKVFQFYSK